MGWGLDASGQLDPHTKRHFMEVLDEHTYMAATMGNFAVRTLEEILDGNQSGERRRHFFATLNQVIVYAGRISATIKPIRKAKGDLAQLRQARVEFMASLFDDPSVEALHLRDVRHRIEHYDERLEDALLETGPSALWVQDAIMPANALDSGNSAPPLLQRSFDPQTMRYVVLGEELDYKEIAAGIDFVGKVTRTWLEDNPPAPVWEAPFRD